MSGEINVISRTQHIIVDPASSSIAVINAGPAGFPGYPAPTPWTAPTFQNGWVNQGPGFQVVQYRKIGDEVQLRGSMKSGIIGIAFTLPVGFRPLASSSVIFGVDSNNAHARVDIFDTGAVYVQTGTPASWVSLAGINFSTIA